MASHKAEASQSPCSACYTKHTLPACRGCVCRNAGTFCCGEEPGGLKLIIVQLIFATRRPQNHSHNSSSESKGYSFYTYNMSKSSETPSSIFGLLVPVSYHSSNGHSKLTIIQIVPFPPCVYVCFHVCTCVCSCAHACACTCTKARTLYFFLRHCPLCSTMTGLTE